MAAVGFGAMLALIAIRMPVGLSMLVVGCRSATSTPVELARVLRLYESNPYHQFANYTLSVIPLFILMGAFAERSGHLARYMFTRGEGVVGHLRGGLAMAVIGACTIFGAICGSSVATTATFGRAALPDCVATATTAGFATGTIAIGGVVGIS